MEERTSERSYYNRGLFSEHYLLNRLPEHPVWREDVRPDFSQILSLYQEKKEFLPLYNERQTEEEFIQPLFSILGFAYTPQVRFKRREQVSIPDFALFTSEESKHDAELTRQSRDDFYETPFFKRVAALTEAKYWGRILDTRASDKRDNPESRNRNPHFQITGYLIDSGVPRGILTNGTHWRLYFSGIESQEILYYEVELQRILEEENESDFRYFYHFFRAAAFEPDAEGRTFLDEVFERSRSYAKQVEERLKERIFEQVVPALARGFFAYRRDVRNVPTKTGLNISQETDESPAARDSDERNLREIFDGTLLFLYRLIFLLYAEARELLPVTERQGYFAYSLTKLKGTIFDERKTGRRFSDVSTSWYDYLKSLFTIINRGDASLNVPRYNGGLFAPAPILGMASRNGLGDRFLQQAAKFLENHAIADSYLAEALMLLTRDLDGTEEPTDARFIDYRDLNVRHLGSIYEGLLEFKLKIAQQPLVKAREKGKEVYKPPRLRRDFADAQLSDAGQILPDVQAGDIYLTNDKSERKATGSYYTPDYIVRYIVENTVGPLIDGILKECQLAQEIRNGNRPWDELFEVILSMRSGDATSQLSPEKSEKEQKAQREAPILGMASRTWKLTRNDNERRRFLLNMLDGSQPWHDYDAPKRILELKILDPAIGSGHFLVGAMDFLTQKLVALLEQFPDSPVLKEIEVTRQKILSEAERQNVRMEAKTLDDENLLRRRVMKRCLYGVDVNPMAVELAKLSLWLHGFTVGAPLSFLDHHLRCGNSLIGATVEEVRDHLQRSLFGQQFSGLLNATDMMQQLAELTDATFTDVQESQSLYDKAQNALAPFKGLLDVWVSEHFGNDSAQITLENFPDSVYSALKHLLNGDVEAPQNSKALQVAQKALELRDEKHFFHWELEFPEVWYEKGDERENPGFDAVIGNPPYGLIADANLKQLVQQNFASVQYQPDIYVAFMERTCLLSNQGGFQSLIVPTTFLTMHYFSAIRRFLLDHCRIDTFVHFKFPVFDDPTVESAIYICQYEPNETKRQSNTVRGIIATSSEEFLAKGFGVQTIPQLRFEEIPENDFNISLDSQSSDIISKVGSGLTESLGVICDIVCGLTPYRFGKGKPPQSREIVDNRMFDATYPKDETSHKYLMGRDFNRYVIAPLEERWISYGEWLAEPRWAAPFFEPKKIIVRQTGDSIIATIDSQQFLNLKNVHNLRLKTLLPKYEYLLAVLNSRIITYFHQQVVPEAGRVFAEVKIVDLERLPIRHIFFTTPKDECAKLLEELKDLYYQEFKTLSSGSKEVEAASK